MDKDGHKLVEGDNVLYTVLSKDHEFYLGCIDGDVSYIYSNESKWDGAGPGSGYKGKLPKDVGYKYSWYVATSRLTKVLSSNTTSSMTILEKFAVAQKSEPEKSFIKVGITDIDGNLTLAGETLFRKWLFESNKVDFKKEVVDAILAYDKAEKKEAKSAE